MKKLVLLFLVVVLFHAVPSFAKTMSFKFSGDINDFGGGDQASIFLRNTNLSSPASFTGTAVIDTTLPALSSNLLAAEYAVKTIRITIISDDTGVGIIVDGFGGRASLESDSQVLDIRDVDSENMKISWAGPVFEQAGLYSPTSIVISLPNQDSLLTLPDTDEVYNADDLFAGEHRINVSVKNNIFIGSSFSMLGDIDSLELVEGDSGLGVTNKAAVSWFSLFLLGFAGLWFRKYGMMGTQ